MAKQVRKPLFFQVLSDLQAGLSGHLLPSHYATRTHMMAELSSDWLIFFVPAPVQGARTQGSAETPAASQCNLGQPVYCTHVCLSSYVHLEHKRTSFVLWETPPHIPARTLPQVRWLGTAKKASQRSRWSVPGSAPAALWGVSKVAYCLSALVHLPVKQAVHTKTSCVS